MSGCDRCICCGASPFAPCDNTASVDMVLLRSVPFMFGRSQAPGDTVQFPRPAPTRTHLDQQKQATEKAWHSTPGVPHGTAPPFTDPHLPHSTGHWVCSRVPHGPVLDTSGVCEQRGKGFEPRQKRRFGGTLGDSPKNRACPGGTAGGILFLAQASLVGRWTDGHPRLADSGRRLLDDG